MTQRFLISVLLLVLAGSAVWGEGTDLPSWLAGHWQNETTEEVWMEPAGGLMLGMNRSLTPDGKAFFEYLRIESSSENTVLFASPLGKPPVAFTMTFADSTRIVFENAEHDFPKKIIYYAPDSRGVLRARIEGDEPSQSKEWKFRSK